MSQFALAAILALLAASLAALVMAGLRSRFTAGRVAIAAGFAACALVAAAIAERVPPIPPARADLPLQTPAPRDVTSRACQGCHPNEYASWHASYHRTMTQPVTPHSVQGDFAGVRAEFSGERFHLYEQGGAYFGDIERREGQGISETVRLDQITGSHHMQVYWIARGAGRTLEAFPLVWLRSEARWIPRLAAFIMPPTSPNDPTVPPSVWNNTCIGCHTTHPRPQLVLEEPRSADSHVTEFGIACEACHGSGKPHADAHRSPLHRYVAHFGDAPDPDIVNPSRLSHVRSTQVCGQCHSVRTFYSESHARSWADHGSSFRPGDDLDVAVSVISNATIDRPYTQAIMRTFPDFVSGSFWDDGIVRVVGREYNALLESGCFQRGELACTSCHELHRTPDDPRDAKTWANDQLTPGMDTDRACTQCHEQFRDTARVTAHTHHAAGSTGSECQNCHMPHTAYGLLKAVRAHEIHSPRILTEGPGSTRPNACNLCHLDRPLAWSAEHLERWYGQAPPSLSDDDRRIAAGVRWVLTGDAGVRALVAWSMGWRPAQDVSRRGWLMPYLVGLMDDPYDAVRMIAARSLATLPETGPGPIDPLGEPASRAALMQALLDRWQTRPASERAANAATLVDANGSLRDDEVARLRAQRDDRPLTLAE